jgi:hypothetical protein
MTATMQRQAHGAAAGQLNEDEFVRMWLAELALDNHSRFNPEVLVKTIYQDRLTYGAPDPVQTRNYVLHCVRLAPHVCRHALDRGVYAMHVEPECGPKCKEAWAQKAKAERGETCPTCFTYKTATGTCACD